jgi:hypothetical protein
MPLMVVLLTGHHLSSAIPQFARRITATTHPRQSMCRGRVRTLWAARIVSAALQERPVIEERASSVATQLTPIDPVSAHQALPV